MRCSSGVHCTTAPGSMVMMTRRWMSSWSAMSQDGPTSGGGGSSARTSRGPAEDAGGDATLLSAREADVFARATTSEGGHGDVGEGMWGRSRQGGGGGFATRAAVPVGFVGDQGGRGGEARRAPEDRRACARCPAESEPRGWPCAETRAACEREATHLRRAEDGSESARSLARSRSRRTARVADTGIHQASRADRVALGRVCRSARARGGRERTLRRVRVGGRARDQVCAPPRGRDVISPRFSRRGPHRTREKAARPGSHVDSRIDGRKRSTGKDESSPHTPAARLASADRDDRPPRSFVVNSRALTPADQIAARVCPRSAPRSGDPRAMASLASPPTKDPRNHWSKEEHAQFLQGVAAHGRGEWAAIARDFVPTRTGTQVCNHGQKYFAKLDRDRGVASISGGASAPARASLAERSGSATEKQSSVDRPGTLRTSSTPSAAAQSSPPRGAARHTPRPRPRPRPTPEATARARM